MASLAGKAWCSQLLIAIFLLATCVNLAVVYALTNVVEEVGSFAEFSLILLIMNFALGSWQAHHVLPLKLFTIFAILACLDSHILCLPAEEFEDSTRGIYLLLCLITMLACLTTMIPLERRNNRRKLLYRAAIEIENLKCANEKQTIRDLRTRIAALEQQKSKHDILLGSICFKIFVLGHVDPGSYFTYSEVPNHGLFSPEASNRAFNTLFTAFLRGAKEGIDVESMEVYTLMRYWYIWISAMRSGRMFEAVERELKGMEKRFSVDQIEEFAYEAGEKIG